MTIPCCNQTITVYRKERGKIVRLVVRNAMFSITEFQSHEDVGLCRSRDFILVVPRGEFIPRVDDRVIGGIGPKQVDWETFVPSNVPRLALVNYVVTYLLDGKVHHYEAGAGSAR